MAGILTIRKNLKSLMDVPGKGIDRAGQRCFFDKLILDLNGSVSETYGRRERRESAARIVAYAGFVWFGIVIIKPGRSGSARHRLRG